MITGEVIACNAERSWHLSPAAICCAGVDLRQLNTFVAVAEERSFTRAADRLHVVQSAVSAGVGKLEHELGTRLFDRSTRSVRLTDAGRALLPEARATLLAAQAARDAVDAVRGGVRGTVLLGTMQAQGMRAVDLAGLLAAFAAAHPLVDIRLHHSGGSTEMVRDVRDGRLDLAFVALPGDGPPGVALTPLANEPIVLAVPDGHPLAGQARIELSALAGEALVDLPDGWGIRMAVDRAFNAAGVPRRITYEVNDTATMVEFIRNRLAVGLLPRSMVDTPAGLAFVAVGDHPPAFRTAVAVPANRRLSAAPAALLETIQRRSAAPARAPAPVRGGARGRP
jgi:DNA-binding transcriptional LysR family regulator